jgi:hypothetical protein
MATLPAVDRTGAGSAAWLAGLSDPARAIASPRIDALCFWGVPLLAFVGASFAFAGASALPDGLSTMAGLALILAISAFSDSHLIAVVPRAYLNREVFEANRFKLTVVPVVLVALLLISPTFLALAGVIAILWDAHHSAMQNFGLARIYDMKAGNKPDQLRATDLRLNWVLYVAPLLAGASLMLHLHAVDRLEGTSLSTLTALPGLFEGHLSQLAVAAILLWIATIGWAILDYRRAMAAGYQLPVHKVALIGSTGLVSLLAWGFASPVVALAIINIYHAIQYFALVWIKEGGRMKQAARGHVRNTLLVFLGLCGIVGLASELVSKNSASWLLAPFIACALLHFWYDSFVWSVTKKQV